MEIADLSDERGTNFGGKLNVVNSVRGLVANLSIGDAKLGGGTSRLAFELGRADGTLGEKKSASRIREEVEK